LKLWWVAVAMIKEIYNKKHDQVLFNSFLGEKIMYMFFLGYFLGIIMAGALVVLVNFSQNYFAKIKIKESLAKKNRGLKIVHSAQEKRRNL